MKKKIHRGIAKRIGYDFLAQRIRVLQGERDGGRKGERAGGK